MDELTKFSCLQRPQFANDVFHVLDEVLNTPQRYRQQARQQMRDRHIDPKDTPSKWPRRTPNTRPTSPSPARPQSGTLFPLTTRTRVETQSNNHKENLPWSAWNYERGTFHQYRLSDLYVLNSTLQRVNFAAQQNAQSLLSPPPTQIYRRPEVIRSISLSHLLFLNTVCSSSSFRALTMHFNQ